MKAARNEILLGLIFLTISVPAAFLAFAFPQESGRLGIDTRILAGVMVALAIFILAHGLYLRRRQGS